MSSFPFPGRESALQELKRDPCCGKIPEGEIPGLIDAAWERGVGAAEEILAACGKRPPDFERVLIGAGLTVERVNADYVAGPTRYFSDYIPGRKLVNLYTVSVSLWAAENRLGISQAENLILAHEFYHYLEWNKIGLTSRLYLVPAFKIGKLKIGKTGIRALSEIGAHAFVCTCFETPGADGKGGTSP